MKAYKFVVFSMIVLLSSVYTQKVNYIFETQNSWGCTTGSRQSPVSLSDATSKYTNTISLLNEFYSPITNGLIYFNQTTKLLEFGSLQNALSGAQANYGTVDVNYNDYIMRFTLRKFVIHAPGEHEIDGIRPDFEIQLHHTKNLDYVSENNKYKKKPDISTELIITIPYKLNGKKSDRLFLNTIRNFYTKTPSQTSVTLPSINLAEYDLAKNKNFFLYSGSGTTFPCNENALHIVFSEWNNITQTEKTQFDNIVRDIYLNNINSKGLALLFGRFTYRNYFVDQTEASTFQDPIILKQKDAKKLEAEAIADEIAKKLAAIEAANTSTPTKANTDNISQDQAAIAQAQGQ